MARHREPIIEPDWKVRPRRIIKSRRRSLARVNLGLALHYPAPFLCLVALTTGSVALFLSAMSRNPRLGDLFASSAHAFLTISSVALLLTSLAQIGPTVLAMWAPGGTGRVLLGLALSLLWLACLSAGLALVLPVARAAFLAVSLLALPGAWVLWMVFLRRLGECLERDTIAEGAVQMCLRVFRVMTLTGGFWLVVAVSVFFVLAVGVLFLSYMPPTLWFLPAIAIGAAARVIWVFGNFETLLEYVLFPTGLPITFEYVNFISGVRKILDRS